MMWKFFSMMLLAVFTLTLQQPFGRAESEEMQKYQTDLNNQTKYHHLLNMAAKLESKKNILGAIAYHEKALKMAVGSSSEPVSRNDLMRLYEMADNFEKALIQAKWFLAHSNSRSPLWNDYIKTNKRLLQKIEESKSKAPIERFKENARKLTSEEQTKFVQSLSEKNVMGQFKKAMAAEQQNDFAGALTVYESLLGQKERVVKEMGIHAWVMLYPGIQRSAELSKNKAKEKEALVWIKGTLLDSKAPYYSSLAYLENRVVAHLQDRIKALGV